MKTIKLSVFAVVSAVSVSAFADWNFNIGYAWRSQAETSFKGAAAQTPAGGVYSDGHVNLGGTAADGYPDWDGGTIGSVQNRTVPTANDYVLILNRADSVAGGSDEDSAHGLTASVGYDLYEGEVISLAANLRFAGYWGIENSSAGGYAAYRDTYRFTGLLSGIDPSPDRTNFDAPDAYVGREYLAGGPGGRVTLKSDLYQIGLGPKVTWHVLSCLDVYGGVEALCTFVNSELDAGGASTDEVNCLWGVGGHVGFTGWMTENIGFFGQVGYEWIDEDDVAVQGIRAETDYSSLVLSAGLQIRF